ncbi:MAG: membrane dipeptidase, partial [Oscillospiraceae bacterium]
MMKLFDLHCDTVSECMSEKLDLDNSKTQLNLSALEQLESWVQVMALFIPDELRNQQAVMYYDRLMSYTNLLLAKHNDKLYPVLKGKDLYNIPNGCCGVIKAIEGGAALAGEIHRINFVYNQGVRLITLTWNGENELGSGALCSPDKGLSEFGKQAVAEMEKVGILVDASHLSRRSFWD